MKPARSLALALLAISVIIVAQPVKASTVTEAKEMIAALRTHTEAAIFGGQHAAQDRDFLLKKLDAASLAVDRGKFCKASRLLDDFIKKVDQLLNDNMLEFESGHGVTVHDFPTVEGETSQTLRDLIAQSGVTCED